jgi:putative CocE/NonD family hydrolase
MKTSRRQGRALTTIGFWVLMLWQSWALGQNLDFHPPANAVDATTPALMRDLASRILPVYQEPDADRYLTNLSALQLVAGNYQAAREARQSLRERRRKADAGRPVSKAMIYDLYAQAKAIETADHVAFSQAYTLTYRAVVPKLSDLDAYALSGWLELPVSGFQEALQKAFDQRRAKGTVALSEAVELVWTYLSFDAYRSFAPLVAALDAENDRQRYVSDDNIQIKGPDGVLLAARLMRPKGDSDPLPTLLEFTIRVDAPSFARECAAHGFVGLIAYARGKGQSNAEIVPFEHDGEDARAVIDWITKQSWSDGRVGMYGSGYAAFAAWAAAKRPPPALKAIATSAATAPGIDVPMTGSIPRNSAYRWALAIAEGKSSDDKGPSEEWHKLDQTWYTSGRPYRELGQIHGKPSHLFTRWLNHPSYDLYWQKMIPYRNEFARLTIPVLTIAGYYAKAEVGSLYYFSQHHRFNSHANQTLLIGPYDDDVMEHGPAATLRGVPVDPAALLELRELQYQWFDHVLKGGSRPELLRSRVNYEVMGANEWRHVASPEAMSRGALRFYLDPKLAGDGHLLSGRKGSSAAFVRQSVSLTDRGDASWTPPATLISRDPQSHNGVTFMTEPLRRPLEIGGQVSGGLDFTLNKQDVDLNITCYEQLPSGEYIQLFDPPYELRASYARDRLNRHLLKAGERQQLSFRSERLMSRRLETGSRLVVVIAVNKRPDQEINYGTGGDVSAESIADGKVPIRIRWYGDSYVDIPAHR